MKSLATLIKLQKTRVDEQRQMLARANDRLLKIEQAIANLEQQKEREKVAAAQDAEKAVTYGAFLKVAIKRGRDLEKERQIAQAAVDAARAALAELFEEQKRYELAEENRIAEERREEARRETAELDEIGGVTHQRRKAE